MKETILSNCERNFVLKAAHELKRLDGRKLEDFRSLKVHFGQDWGLCYVALGETKVLTQVSCEIQEPKTTRPNEGLLFVNVELSSMAAPHFESGRVSDLSVHINRLLEKCLKDSQAVDLESLCIVAEEKVWALRVDVNVLNHEGSLVDCASISALAALAHFKRPDVTTNGEDIIIHSVFDRDPIPIVLHHYPVCVSFALLNNSENIFADPTVTEERVSDASLTFGINAYKEICCLHLGGIALTKPKIILICSTKAAKRAKEVVEVIKEALKNDAATRQLKKQTGFVDNFEWDKVTAISNSRLKIQLPKYCIGKEQQSNEEVSQKVEDKSGNFEVINLGNNCAQLTSSSNLNVDNSNDALPPPNKLFKNAELTEKSMEMSVDIGEGGASQWVVDLKTPIVVSDSDSEEDKDEVQVVPVEHKAIENIELSGDSEEDEVVILNANISNPQTSYRPRKTDQKPERNNSVNGGQISGPKNRKNKKKKGKGSKT